MLHMHNCTWTSRSNNNDLKLLGVLVHSPTNLFDMLSWLPTTYASETDSDTSGSKKSSRLSGSSCKNHQVTHFHTNSDLRDATSVWCVRRFKQMENLPSFHTCSRCRRKFLFSSLEKDDPVRLLPTKNFCSSCSRLENSCVQREIN